MEPACKVLCLRRPISLSFELWTKYELLAPTSGFIHIPEPNYGSDGVNVYGCRKKQNIRKTAPESHCMKASLPLLSGCCESVAGRHSSPGCLKYSQ